MTCRDESPVSLTKQLNEAQVQHDPGRTAQRRRKDLVIREADEARDEDDCGANASRESGTAYDCKGSAYPSTGRLFRHGALADLGFLATSVESGQWKGTMAFSRSGAHDFRHKIQREAN